MVVEGEFTKMFIKMDITSDDIKKYTDDMMFGNNCPIAQKFKQIFPSLRPVVFTYYIGIEYHYIDIDTWLRINLPHSATIWQRDYFESNCDERKLDPISFEIDVPYSFDNLLSDYGKKMVVEYSVYEKM